MPATFPQITTPLRPGATHRQAAAPYVAPSSLLLCLALLGALSSPARAQLGHSSAGYGAVWAEFMPLEEVSSALPQLAGKGIAINLEWPSDDVKNPERFELVREAARFGIEVRPWLLLPEDQGYWANAENAPAFAAAARELLLQWSIAELRPTRLIVDMEMSIKRIGVLAELVESGDLSELIDFLEQGVDRAQYRRATRVYAELTDELHAEGWKVDLGTVAEVLDDYTDGDDGVRQAFGIPVDGIDWDTVTFIAYRTLAEGVVGRRPTRHYVYDYARLARRRFGSRAAIAMGMTDPGEITADAPFYTRGSQLRDDVEVALQAGIPAARLSVYNLRGIVRQPPVSQWLKPPRKRWLAPFPDPLTALAHNWAGVLDLFL